MAAQHHGGFSIVGEDRAVHDDLAGLVVFAVVRQGIAVVIAQEFGLVKNALYIFGVQPVNGVALGVENACFVGVLCGAYFGAGVLHGRKTGLCDVVGHLRRAGFGAGSEAEGNETEVGADLEIGEAAFAVVIFERALGS